MHQLGADSHEMVSIQEHIRIQTVLPHYVRVIARYYQKAESATHILVNVLASLLLGSSNLTPLFLGSRVEQAFRYRSNIQEGLINLRY